MKIIKNALVYKMQLPSIELMAGHLAEIPFEPIGELFRSRSGFMPNQTTADLLTHIAGGYSFTVRHDEKILPAASVRAALREAYLLKQEEIGRDLSDEEQGLLTESVTADLVAKALVKTWVVNCFYHIDDQYLVVATGNKNLSAVVAGLLVKCVGSVKTTTIHIAEIKNGLTSKLEDYLQGYAESFGEFGIGGYCLLKEKTAKATFDLGRLESAKEGILEARASGMQVECMALTHKTMSFKLNKEFALKKIEFFGELTEDEEEQYAELDPAMLWRTEAAKQLLELKDAINSLCKMFDYEAPDAEPSEAAC